MRIALFLLFGIAAFTLIHLHPNTPKAHYIHSETVVKPPTIDIMCRTFWGAFWEIQRLVLTYRIFWPRHVFRSRVVIVLDDESERDHMMGTVLAYAFDDIVVAYETLPKARTFTSDVSHEGFSRTQWSNFYSDRFSSAHIIGIVDSDAEFFFRADPSHVLADGRPVIHGFGAADPFFACVDFMIGKPAVAEFMYQFPFLVRREHFAPMRAHIAATTGLTFEEAWYQMQLKFPKAWGQFIVMGNYLWHFHRDAYAWQISHDPNKLSTVSGLPMLAKNLQMSLDVETTIAKYMHQICAQANESECDRVTPIDPKYAALIPYTDHWPFPAVTSGDAVYQNGHNYDRALWHDYFPDHKHPAFPKHKWSSKKFPVVVPP